MLKRLIPVLVLAVSLLCGHSASAQDGDDDMTPAGLARIEDSLYLLTDSVYHAPIPDTRIYYTEQFVKMLVRALRVPGSFNYPFEKLKDRVNIIYPEDKSFRIFNWVIAAPNENNRRYYGAIQMAGEQLKLYGLIDYSDKMNNSPEDSVLTGGKWLGAIYYNIKTVEVDGQTIYTLFGLNESGYLSKKKILEPMILTGNGPQFGAPIFGLNAPKSNKPIQRFVLEYKKGVQVSLNWDDEKKAIYFDRLTSESGDEHRKYTFVPTGQYDGFRWMKDKWIPQRDLIPVMELKDGDAPSGAPITPETK